MVGGGEAAAWNWGQMDGMQGGADGGERWHSSVGEGGSASGGRRRRSGRPSLLSPGPEKLEVEDVVWFNHSQGQKCLRKKYLDEKCFANERYNENGILANAHDLRMVSERITF